MEGRVLGKRYLLDIRIAKGGFSEIYIGVDTKTKKQIAIKMESVKEKPPQLLFESKLYKLLHGGTGIPNTRLFGSTSDYNFLVMDLLGPSFESPYFRNLPLNQVLIFADQMINCIEFVHSKSFLHRSIKPGNFVLGTGMRSNQVYIIDFGLAKRYRNPSSHEHIPYRENKKILGNPTYASMYTHRGFEQSRRDDMESLGYVLMYMLRGSFPWEEIKADTGRQRCEKIGEKKASTSIEDLCRGYPTEFASYFNYCRSLKFEDEPDYTRLKRIFRDLFIREGLDKLG
ncbi:casein kinase 1-like protein 1, partial [Lycium barbarum]|uniref:casein kinase 1-like protein 1 n=1 Tax=Lycium barbarum TaxID=112863 RepID=UPI00293E6BEE